MKVTEMETKAATPKWWLLYLTFPLLMGLFFLDSRLDIAAGAHELFQLSSVLVEFVLVQVWLRANASALRQMDDESYQTQITVIEFPATPGRDAARGTRPIVPAPDTEIKGVLSDTFEMETVDAGARHRGEVSQEVRKTRT